MSATVTHCDHVFVTGFAPEMATIGRLAMGEREEIIPATIADAPGEFDAGSNSADSIKRSVRRLGIKLRFRRSFGIRQGARSGSAPRELGRMTASLAQTARR